MGSSGLARVLPKLFCLAEELWLPPGHRYVRKSEVASRAARQWKYTKCRCFSRVLWKFVSYT